MEDSCFFAYHSELAILGTIIDCGESNETALPEIFASVSENDFHDPRTKYFFTVLKRIYESPSVILRINKRDTIEFIAEKLGALSEKDLAKWGFKSTTEVRSVWARACSMSVSDGRNTMAKLKFHIERVRAAAAFRSIMEIASGAHKRIKDGEAETPEIIATEMIAKLSSIVEAGNSNNSIASIISSLKELIENADKRKSQATITTGLPTLDSILHGGWRKGQLIIVGARPRIGKSALLSQFAYHAARHMKNGRKVVFASLEMTTEELVSRMIAQVAKIPHSVIRYAAEVGLNGSTPTVSHIVSTIGGQIASLPLEVCTPRSSNVNHVMSAIVEACNGKPGVIIIDYLQLMGTGARSENRVMELQAITRTLKTFALQFECTIIAASQLNRAIESRNGAPRLADLRESGSIEQDADIVIFPVRPELAKLEEDIADLPPIEDAEIIVAKHRNGPCGHVSCKFVSPLVSYLELEEGETSALVKTIAEWEAKKDFESKLGRELPAGREHVTEDQVW